MRDKIQNARASLLLTPGHHRIRTPEIETNTNLDTATTLGNITVYTQETAELDKRNLRKQLKTLETQILNETGSKLQTITGLSACTLIIRNNNLDYYEAEANARHHTHHWPDRV